MAAGPATGAVPSRRRPVWQEIEEERSRRIGERLRRRQTASRRLAVVYDIEGPRVRLGLLWFAAGVAALVAGPIALALLYGVVAAAAATQAARAWRQRQHRPNRLVAGVAAASLPVAALLGSGWVGLGLLGLAAAAVMLGAAEGRTAVPLADAGLTVQCGLFVGLAAAAPVLAARLEVGAAVTLLLVVAAYETGDYLVGSGAANPFEGPAAGIAGIVVITFAVSVLGVPPFDVEGAWIFGAMAAVLCPLGQLAGSLVLPASTARAPALRRLDSLLVLGPVWVVAVSAYLPA